MKAFSVRKKILSVLLAIVTVIGVVSPVLRLLRQKGTAVSYPFTSLKFFMRTAHSFPLIRKTAKPSTLSICMRQTKSSFSIS